MLLHNIDMHMHGLQQVIVYIQQVLPGALAKVYI